MNNYQKSFIQNLMNIRDDVLEKDADELVGSKYSDISYNLIKGYFGERLFRIPLRMPSPYMNCDTFASYLNDEVLYYIYEENCEYMDVDWRQLFVCKKDHTQSDDFNGNDSN
jgi:hypothetical protein